jgi:hypothetical protein
VELPHPPDPSGPRAYVIATLETAGTPEAFAEPAALARLRAQAEAVLRAEAPVCFDRLARTIAEAWGIARLTDRVRERVRTALGPATAELGGALWRVRDDAAAFAGFRGPVDGETANRSAEELPLAEIGNAMEWLLRQHHALAADDLAREAAKCFGITRLGTVVRGVMNEALERLLEAGRAVGDGTAVRLP